MKTIPQRIVLTRRRILLLRKLSGRPRELASLASSDWPISDIRNDYRACAKHGVKFERVRGGFRLEDSLVDAVGKLKIGPVRVSTLWVAAMHGEDDEAKTIVNKLGIRQVGLGK